MHYGAIIQLCEKIIQKESIHGLFFSGIILLKFISKNKSIFIAFQFSIESPQLTCFSVFTLPLSRFIPWKSRPITLGDQGHLPLEIRELAFKEFMVLNGKTFLSHWRQDKDGWGFPLPGCKYGLTEEGGDAERDEMCPTSTECRAWPWSCFLWLPGWLSSYTNLPACCCHWCVDKALLLASSRSSRKAHWEFSKTPGL